MIEVADVVEHENGDATYTFEMDSESAKVMTELGIKLVLYCSVCSVTPQEVFDELLQEAKSRQVEIEETVAGRYEMSMPGEKDYEV